MVDISIIPATHDHAAIVAATMRPADLAEVLASGGHDPLTALTRSISLSTHSWAGLVDGQAAALFGVGPASLASGIGCPWFLGSTLLDAHPRPMLSMSRDWLDRIAQLYPHLENHVDARNRRAVRWLSWLGFSLHPAAPHGPHGLPFHRFTWGW
jgi:hypothetical protein